MKDAISNIKFVDTETVLAGATSTATDRQGFNSVGFLIIPSGDYTDDLHLEESDDNVTFTRVADNVTYGNEVRIEMDAKGKVGYTGYKRYVRCNAGGSGGSYSTSIVTIMGEPNSAPVE